MSWKVLGVASGVVADATVAIFSAMAPVLMSWKVFGLTTVAAVMSPPAIATVAMRDVNPRLIRIASPAKLGSLQSHLARY